MAVQKNRKTRSKRDMRRSHYRVLPSTLSEDPTTGTRHRRHHISDDGFYKGEEIIAQPVVKDANEEAEV